MRDEVIHTVGGRDIRFRFGNKALCALEERTGLSLDDIVSEMGARKRQSLHLRALVWAAADLPTLDDASALIDEIGGAEVMTLINRAIVAAFPPQEADGGNGEAAG
jgi:hypothetical protein